MAAFEVMATNLRVKDSILNGESEGKTFNDIIIAGKAQGMISFDEFIIALFEEGKIDEATASAYASRKDIVGRGLDAIKSARGESTTNIDSLGRIMANDVVKSGKLHTGFLSDQLDDLMPPDLTPDEQTAVILTALLGDSEFNRAVHDVPEPYASMGAWHN